MSEYFAGLDMPRIDRHLDDLFAARGQHSQIIRQINEMADAITDSSNRRKYCTDFALQETISRTLDTICE